MISEEIANFILSAKLDDVVKARFFNFSFPMLITSLVSLLIIIGILFYFVRKPLNDWLEITEKKNASDAKLIKDAIINNSNIQTQLQDELQTTLNKRIQILDESKTQALEQKKKIVRAANEEGKYLINQSKKEAEVWIEEKEKEIKHNIVKNSILLSEKILQKTLTDKDHKELIDDFIDNLNDVKK